MTGVATSTTASHLSLDQVQDDDQGTWTAGANLLFKGDDIKLQAHYLRSDVPGGETEAKAILRMQVIF